MQEAAIATTTAIPTAIPTAKLAADDYLSLMLFYQLYAENLDAGNLAQWPDYFTEDCVYQVQPRENFDRNLPLATMAYESKGMLRDRVYCVRETLYYEPYYQRHVVGAPVVTQVQGDAVHAHASYAVFRTKPDATTEVYNVGRYVDELVRRPETALGWLLKSRRCIFDSDLILNSMIYPI